MKIRVRFNKIKQWEKYRDRFLETGEPRKQAYSEDEIALIQMGWEYGYDAGVLQEREACVQIVNEVGKKLSKWYWDYEYDLLAEILAKKIVERGEK